MDYQSGQWSYGAAHGQPAMGNDRRRPYNPGNDPMQEASVAFAAPYSLDQPHLSLNTHLPGPFDSQLESATTPTPFGQSESIKHFMINEEPWSARLAADHRLDGGFNPHHHHHHHPADHHHYAPRSPAPSTSAASALGLRQYDSAYASNASPTTQDPATAGSDCSDLNTMFGRMPYPLTAAAAPPDTPSTPIKQQPPARRAASSVPSNADENIVLPENGKCTYCDRHFRLKSELKKHMLRHTRPFRCRIPGCNGLTEGFTTSNDLDRHNRSVHSIFPPGAKVYICAAKNCAEGEKVWPRYDNFKQHCERMHKKDDLDALIQRSERPAPPPPDNIQQYLTEYDTKPGSSSARKRAPVSDTASIPPRASPSRNSQVDAFFGYPASDSASYSGYHTGSGYNDFSDDPNTRIAQRQIRNMHSGRKHAAAATTTTGGSVASGRLSGHSGRSGAHRTPQIVLHQVHDGTQKQRQSDDLSHIGRGSFDLPHPTLDTSASTFQKLVDEHSPVASPSAMTANNNNNNNNNNLLQPNVPRSRSLSSHSSASSTNRSFRGRANTISGGDVSRSAVMKRKQESITSGGSAHSKRVRCKWPGCSKADTDMRPCELKKHERRHSRPFGCTFDYCHKAFGSKNDWKRHEASQHFQDEAWRCALRYQPLSQASSGGGVMTLSQSECETNTDCAEVFWEQSEFELHLTDHHGLVDKAQVQDTCDMQHIGRDHCGTFWCGFCKAVVFLQHQGRKGWDERFNHIGEHFHPGNLKIADWLPLSGNETKGELQAKKQRQAEADRGDSSEAPSVADDDPSDAEASATVSMMGIELTTSPVDATSFPTSPDDSFDPSVMPEINFIAVGSALSSAPQLTLNTAQPTNMSGQLPSPAASGSNEAPSSSSTKQSRLSGDDINNLYCCQCNDGPMSAFGLCSCTTCGHLCQKGVCASSSSVHC